MFPPLYVVIEEEEDEEYAFYIFRAGYWLTIQNLPRFWSWFGSWLYWIRNE